MPFHFSKLTYGATLMMSWCTRRRTATFCAAIRQPFPRVSFGLALPAPELDASLTVEHRKAAKKTQTGPPTHQDYSTLKGTLKWRLTSGKSSTKNSQPAQLFSSESHRRHVQHCSGCCHLLCSEIQSKLNGDGSHCLCRRDWCVKPMFILQDFVLVSKSWWIEELDLD